MKADRFLRNLEEYGLLSRSALAKLRAQVGDKASRMSAKAIARLLVEKGLLTKQQVGVALSDSVDPSDAEADDVIPLEEDPGDVAQSDSDLGFAPLEEDEEKYKEETIPEPTTDRAESKSESPSQQDIVELEPASEGESDRDSFDEFGFSGPTDVVAPPLAPPSVSPDETLPSEVSAEDEFKGDEATLTQGAAKRTGRKKRSRKKRHKNQSEFDSPLILLGGGALILLVLIAAIVWYLVNRDTGDALLASAHDQFKGGSYSQAIDSYERFVKSFPNHARISEARVQLAIAKIRKATEGTTDFHKSLMIADAEIRGIEDEEQFRDAHNELAALLERIVRGSAEQAVSAEGADVVEKRVADTEEALRLINNTKYVPKSLRPVEAIQDVRQMLELVERRRAREETRQTAIDAIAGAAKSGNVRAAYQVYRELLNNHPEFAGDALVRDAVVKIAEAERARTLFVEDPLEASAVDNGSVIVASIALADHVGNASSGRPPRLVFFRIDGALYSLNADSGELLWRRFVGFDHEATPLPVADDVIVVDASREALVRLDGTSGQMRWRLELGDKLLAPVHWDENRILLATRSGKLRIVDAETGFTPGYVQFSQPLPAPPLVDAKNERVFVVGEHSSVYLLVGEKLLCKDVFHLGHLASSISVSPVAVLDHVVVAENFGENASRLHGLSLRPDGTIKKTIDPIRLEGHVTSPPIVDGRRVAVLTDRGEIRVFDVAAGQSEDPLAQVASRAATGEPDQQFGLLHKGQLWVAGSRLAKFAILPTGSRLQALELPKPLEGDAFDGLLQRAGDFIIHLRRREGRVGATVAALDAQTGRVAWQTHLAAPPAGDPIVDLDRREIAVASQNGQVYLLDQEVIRARVQNTPLAAKEIPDRLQLQTSTALSDGMSAFSGDREAVAEGLLLLQRAGDRRELRWLSLPSPLACAPVPFAGGLLCPLQVGQVVLVDPTTGKITATFQPRIDSREPVGWTRPAVTPDGRRFVIADQNGRLFLVEAANADASQMKAIAEAGPLPSRIAAPAAVALEAAVVGTADGQLRSFSIPELENLPEIDLGAPISWGPYMAGGSALMATENGDVVCIGIDGKLRWRQPLSQNLPVGTPLNQGDNVALATSDGQVLLLRMADGTAAGRVDAGQPLGAGPVAFGKRWILTTYDGSLLVIDAPQQ